MEEATVKSRIGGQCDGDNFRRLNVPLCENCLVLAALALNQVASPVTRAL